MELQIIETPLEMNLYGCSGIAVNRDYAGTAFKLSGRMWQILKSNSIKNKGLNIWVYEPGDIVFTGVELESPFPVDNELEQKNIRLARYARFKYVGPWNRIKQAGKEMTDELNRMGLVTQLPYIEIYGHWTADESNQETELITALR